MKSRFRVFSGLALVLGIPLVTICIIAFCGLGFFLFGSKPPPKVERPEERIPTPAVDSEREAYVAKVSKNLADTGESFDNLASLMKEAKAGDVQWTSDMAKEILVIRTNYNDLVKTVPPYATKEEIPLFNPDRSRFALSFPLPHRATGLWCMGIEHLRRLCNRAP